MWYKVNKRLIWTQQVRPNDWHSKYQEVQYIGANWTQYIDTWVIWENKYSVEAKYNPASFEYDTDVCIVWCRWDSRPNYTFFVWLKRYSSNTPSHCQYLNSDYSHSWWSVYTWNNYVVVSNLKTSWNSLVVNWSTLGSWTYSSSYSVWRNMTIFGALYQWSLVNKLFWEIYYVKIKDISWNSVREFVPCYRKSDSVIWMYDTVNDVFYTNAWTGTFYKWPDVN
jgi:hypothetical protein